jgi:hypothetical protein
MENLTRYIALFDLVISLLIKGIRMGEISKLGWFVPAVTFNFQNPSFTPAYPTLFSHNIHMLICSVQNCFQFLNEPVSLEST